MSKRHRHKHKHRHAFHRQADPGSSPGIVRPSPDANKPVIHAIRYGADVLVEADITDLNRLPEMLSHDTVLWVNVEGVGDAETIEQLGAIFGLHPLSLEDVVNIHQRPKVEEYEQYLFIIARMVSRDEHLESEQLSIFLGRNFLITIQDGREGDCLDPVRRRLRQRKSKIHTGGADYLAYAVIDAVVDAYFPIIEQYGDLIDQLDDEVTTGGSRQAITRILALRRDLLTMRKIAWRMRDAINVLIRDESELLDPDVHVFLRDCYDHTVQIIDVVDSYRELSADLREFYMSQIANRTNDVMKVLTIISTIFIPLGFVAGVYGMNFNTSVSQWNMPELHWRLGYPFSLALMGLIAGVLMYFFWRRGWLKRW